MAILKRGSGCGFRDFNRQNSKEGKITKRQFGDFSVALAHATLDHGLMHPRLCVQERDIGTPRAEEQTSVATVEWTRQQVAAVIGEDGRVVLFSRVEARPGETCR